MEFGASVWPFQWNPPYEDAIRRIARLGLHNVELIAWNGDVLREYYTPGRVSALRRLIQDEGLKHSEFVSSPPGAASADSARRAAAVEHFKRAAETARELGATIINSVVPTPFDLRFPPLRDRPMAQLVSVELPSGLDWKAGYAYYVDTLRQLCAICAQHGLRYALETHPYRWATTAQSLLRLFEHVNSPLLGTNLDPSHLFPCGELPQIAVYDLGDRVFHTHFSDNDGTTNAHWRPGKGKIDWAATLVALHAVGYKGVISIELEDVPGRANRDHPTADPVFDDENLASRRYLADLAAELKLPLT